MNSNRPITAAQLLAQLSSDVEYNSRMSALSAQRQDHFAQLKAEAAPLYNELAKAGFQVDDITSLRHPAIGGKSALPPLLNWLCKDISKPVKSWIVLALSGKWAGPEALAPLISEYHRIDPSMDELPNSLRVEILIAIEGYVDESVFDDLVAILEDKTQGEARGYAALALAKLKSHSSRSVPILLRIAHSNEKNGPKIFALIALGILRAKEARPLIEESLNHEDPWVRTKMKQALSKMK